MDIRCTRIVLIVCVATVFVGAEPPARIEVDAGHVRHRVSRYLTGACIEDVNHEIYGGLYSQMIFGESFQEPSPVIPPKGFSAFGGRWQIDKGGDLWAESGDGPKLISQSPAFDSGEAGVEVFLPGTVSGNAGLLVKVSHPGMGADTFDGYEISLDNARQIVRLGRHRHNWELLEDMACEVPVDQWIRLGVKMTDNTIEVFVGGKSMIRYPERERPLRSGSVGLRVWQREAKFRNFHVKVDDSVTPLPFERHGGEMADVSGMWRVVKRDSAIGRWRMETDRPFTGRQSQRIDFAGGEGEVGIENQGLNRWGMYFVERKSYDGYVWVKASEPVSLFVGMENREGSKVYCESELSVPNSDWKRIDFSLVPNATDTAGRFVLKLKRPGSVVVGHVFLHPGEWGRFKGLPVRKDVSEALIDQGITILRYGGSMINHPEYRWKNMIGPRDRRPPYRGTWYPYSSNGWGIIDFLDFCEAAGFLCIPTFHIDETPQDMADFIEYVNGPADSPWGRKRAEDGHSAPYKLRYLQLGNEERVDDGYYQRFKALAETIWRRDSEIILVVGDFIYGQPISDPFQFQGAASGITTLAAQQKILQMARQHDREVWFDIHVGTDGPRPDETFSGMFSFADALGRIADGAKHRVVVFEFNAGNHSHKRALANALAIQAIERDGRIPVALSANCLQPDGQNDNGWDQGLLFLNPSRVWLQPAGYVTRMISRSFQPVVVDSIVHSPDGVLDVSAKRSEDGKTLVLSAVNLADDDLVTTIQLKNFSCTQSTASVDELSGQLNAKNSAEQPNRLVSTHREWKHEFKDGITPFVFKPNSFTILRFE